MTAVEIVRALRPHSDRGSRRRPGIPGTQKALDHLVLDLVKLRHYESAAHLIECKVREAYRIPETAA